LPKAYDGEKRTSSTNSAGKNLISACRKLILDPCLSPCTSIDPNWIKDLNIRPETLKLLQKRAVNTLEVIRIGKEFLRRTQATQ
jgi:hypothetical protein